MGAARKYCDTGWMGRKFHDWTVVEDGAIPISGGSRALRVKCKCGLISAVKITHLTHGTSKRCKSCCNGDFIDYSGYKFNDWTVVRPADGVGMWVCECKCGTQLAKKRSVIKAGKVKRCQRCSSLQNRKGVWNTVWQTLLHGASSRNIPVEITLEQAKDLLRRQGYRCALSGILLRVADICKDMGSENHTISLDRIDSKGGYTLENVQWVHKRVNIMKMGFPEDEYIYFCMKVAEHSGLSFPAESITDWAIRLSGERNKHASPIIYRPSP